jgi:mono/diheme cytochrome c family protein
VRVGIVVLSAAVAVTSTSAATDSRGQAQRPPSPPAAATQPGNAERGRYLVERVAMCVECHSQRDPGGTILPAQRYMGGPLPPAPPWASDWALRAPRNAGLPGYSDDMARRLLMEGAIGRDNVPLRPPMPRYRMSRQDADDVIAFMRTMP